MPTEHRQESKRSARAGFLDQSQKKSTSTKCPPNAEAFHLPPPRLPRSISKEIDLHQMPTERRSVPPSSTKASSINLKRNRPPPNAHRTPKRSTFLTNFVSTRANLLGFGWNMTF